MHLAIGLLLFYAHALAELPVRRIHPLLFSNLLPFSLIT
jgi:hypothetical protein